MFKLKKGDVEFMSKDKAFWKDKKEVSEQMITAMETDLKEGIPRLIKFHKEVVKMCETQMKHLK